MRHEGYTAVTVKTVFSWILTPCSFADGYWLFYDEQTNSGGSKDA
jgi:hypothetical protein